MAELPSKEELEKLYYDKSSKALVWYVLRNTLRVLPVLGKVRLDTLWSNSSVRYIYDVCSVPLMLNAYEFDQKKVNGRSYNLMFSNIAASNIANAFRKINTEDEMIVTVVRLLVAAYAVLKVIDIDHRSAVRNTFMVSRLAASVFDGDVIALARSDFNYLYLNSSFEGVSCLYGKACSEKNEELKKSFLSQLILMGFKEIAKDIQDLLEGKENNAKSYFDKISQSIMDDSSLVKRMASGEQLEEINVVRVVFLGSGGAGKTSLVKALLGYEDFDKKDKELGSSHLSVDLQKMFPYLELSSDRKIEIFLWDFSGHAISYGLHTAFITENCVGSICVSGS